MNINQLEKKKKAIYLNWDNIRDKMLAGEKIEREIIVDAMDQCNAIDQELMNLSTKDYMKKRNSALVDCDKFCGDENVDALHQKLREQYQTNYGKDIKHG